jgi:hypothetical protein
MAWSEVVEEQGKFRAVIEIDESPSEPDWDGQAAVMALGGRNDSTVEAKNSAAEEFESALGRFAEQYTDRKAVELFERWLRIYHGTRSFSVKFCNGRDTDYNYLSFDTAKLREEWGLIDGWDEGKDAKDVENTLSKCDLDAWYAWATGDVWGIRVERSTGFVKTWEDGTVEDGREWVTVEDTEVWGYYGRDDAEEQARETLKVHATE